MTKYIFYILYIVSISQAGFAGDVTATQVDQIKQACKNGVIGENKCLATLKDFKSKIKSKKAELEIVDKMIDRVINEINEGQ